MAPLKPTVRAGEISILMATRARPEMLAEVLASLKINTARKEKTAMWIYIDQDDATTQKAVESGAMPEPGFPVHWHVGPQTGGLGETHQLLWKQSGRTSEVYMISVDDARFDTAGWDDIVRAEFARYPDGVLLSFPHDPMTADAATYPILGWAWIETLQSVFPGYFPYWFDDKWVNQIGQMAGRCSKLPVVLYPIRGKGRTRRMRNLPFWTRFFQLTLDERKDAARRLVATMHPQDDSRRAEALAALEKTAAGLAREEQTFSDTYCVFQEERHTELTPEERQSFDPKYFRTEAAAVARLLSAAKSLADRQQYAEAITRLDAVQLSDLKVRQAYALMAECLRATGRSAEADRLAKEALAVWPQMNSLRRAFRFLGMVANDGKRMLVGLTEKGKKKGGTADK